MERDPFHKEGDFSSLNSVQPNNEIFILAGSDDFASTNLSDKINTDQIAFQTETPVIITARPAVIKKNSTIDNKLDIPISTTALPKKKKTTVKTPRPSIAVINNKLDFEQNLLFVKRVKRDSQSIQNSPRKLARAIRETIDEEKTDLTTAEPFDTLIGTQKVELKLIKPSLVEFKSSLNVSSSRYDNDYEYKVRPYQLIYHSNPSTNFLPYGTAISKTSRRPVSYQNNRPNYQNTNIVSIKPPFNSPISNQHSTPFSYDTYQDSGSINSVSSQSSYENREKPPKIVFNIPQSDYSRPSYSTTKRVDLSTFQIIQTTKRTPTPYYINNKRTTQRTTLNSKLDFDQQISFNTPSPFNNLPPFFKDNSDDLSNESSLNAYKAFSKTQEESQFSQDTFKQTDDNFDEYLQKNNIKPSYNDYSEFNKKPDASMTNHEDKSEEDPGPEIFNGSQTNRYAQFFDENLNEKESQRLNSSTRTSNDKHLNVTKISKNKSRAIHDNDMLAQFKLLTILERPHKWQTNEQGTKARLPDVPTLVQYGKLAKELPKPISSKPKQKL